MRIKSFIKKSIYEEVPMSLGGFEIDSVPRYDAKYIDKYIDYRNLYPNIMIYRGFIYKRGLLVLYINRLINNIDKTKHTKRKLKLIKKIDRWLALLDDNPDTDSFHSYQLDFKNGGFKKCKRKY